MNRNKDTRAELTIDDLDHRRLAGIFTQCLDTPGPSEEPTRPPTLGTGKWWPYNRDAPHDEKFTSRSNPLHLPDIRRELGR